MIISSNYKFLEVEVLYQRVEQIKNFELYCKNPLQIDYIYLYSQEHKNATFSILLTNLNILFNLYHMVFEKKSYLVVYLSGKMNFHVFFGRVPPFMNCHGHKSVF